MDNETHPAPTISRERADLVEALARHRAFLRSTCAGIGDDDARRRSTVSELTLASLLKHVADTEEQWLRFASTGAMPGAEGWPETRDGEEWDPAGDGDEGWVDTRFLLDEQDTLDRLLGRYEEVAAATEEVIRTADLDVSHPLPPAPWFEPGAVWSVRRVLLHVLAETSQHAGHADVIREAIDGHKTMG